MNSSSSVSDLLLSETTGVCLCAHLHFSFYVYNYCFHLMELIFVMKSCNKWGLRALMVNTQELGLVSSTYTVAHHHLQLLFQGTCGFFWLQGHICPWYIDIHAGKINVKVEK